MLKKIALITGSNGFIGFHLSKLLLKNDWFVVGYDGMTDYYDVNLKKNREKQLLNSSNFKSYHGMLEDKIKLFNLIKKYKPSVIIHLAAQAGVRYSILNPESYFNSNLLGTFHILEATKILKLNIFFLLQHLLYMDQITVYHLMKTKKQTRKCHFMRHQKKLKFFLIHTHIFIKYL